LGVKSGKGFYTYPNPEFLDPDFLSPKKRGGSLPLRLPAQRPGGLRINERDERNWAG
jgi:hypothetical protein